MSNTIVKHQIILVAFISTMLASCAVETVETYYIPPAMQNHLLNQLKQGTIELTCQSRECAGKFNANLSTMKELYVRRDWSRLALQVILINTRSDLGYYYLGRAAEELGAPEAAYDYYKKSFTIATSSGLDSGKCYSVDLNQCNGILLPSAILSRIGKILTILLQQIAQQKVAQQRATPQRATPQKKDGNATVTGLAVPHPTPKGRSSAPSRRNRLPPTDEEILNY